MKRFWNVVLVLGVLVAYNVVYGVEMHCAKLCTTGYRCVIDEDMKPACKMAPEIIATIVIACVLLVLLCPLVCVGMFFCGAFACMPRLFNKAANRFLNNKNGRGGRASYSAKKKRAEKAAKKKKKKLMLEGKKASTTSSATSFKSDHQDQLFAAQSYEQAELSGSSGKSHSAYDFPNSTAPGDDPV